MNTEKDYIDFQRVKGKPLKSKYYMESHWVSMSLLFYFSFYWITMSVNARKNVNWNLLLAKEAALDWVKSYRIINAFGIL